MGCLYSLESPSNKVYIGITLKSAEDRWRVHQMRVKEGRDHALQRAIRWQDPVMREKRLAWRAA